MPDASGVLKDEFLAIEDRVIKAKKWNWLRSLLTLTLLDRKHDIRLIEGLLHEISKIERHPPTFVALEEAIVARTTQLVLKVKSSSDPFAEILNKAATELAGPLKDVLLVMGATKSLARYFRAAYLLTWYTESLRIKELQAERRRTMETHLQNLSDVQIGAELSNRKRYLEKLPDIDFPVFDGLVHPLPILNPYLEERAFTHDFIYHLEAALKRPNSQARSRRNAEIEAEIERLESLSKQYKQKGDMRRSNAIEDKIHQLMAEWRETL